MNTRGGNQGLPEVVAKGLPGAVGGSQGTTRGGNQGLPGAVGPTLSVQQISLIRYQGPYGTGTAAVAILSCLIYHTACSA